eukprot:2767-Heterococcus_DN1.PRE.2
MAHGHTNEHKHAPYNCQVLRSTECMHGVYVLHHAAAAAAVNSTLESSVRKTQKQSKHEFNPLMQYRMLTAA